MEAGEGSDEDDSRVSFSSACGKSLHHRSRANRYLSFTSESASRYASATAADSLFSSIPVIVLLYDGHFLLLFSLTEPDGIGQFLQNCWRQGLRGQSGQWHLYRRRTKDRAMRLDAVAQERLPILLHFLWMRGLSCAPYQPSLVSVEISPPIHLRRSHNLLARWLSNVDLGMRHQSFVSTFMSRS